MYGLIVNDAEPPDESTTVTTATADTASTHSDSDSDGDTHSTASGGVLLQAVMVELEFYVNVLLYMRQTARVMAMTLTFLLQQVTISA